MKRIICFLLIATMLVSSSLSFAAPGDFIHTGEKKYYNVKTSSGKADLIKDLKSKDKAKFYREVENGKYVNVLDEETKHRQALEQFLEGNNIDLEDITDYFQDPKNSEKVQSLQNSLDSATRDLSEDFDSIADDNKGDLDDYFGETIYAPKLSTPENYSIPEAGLIEGTTRIVNLNSYNASTKWIYKIVVDLPKLPKENEAINDGLVYTEAANIEIDEGNSIMLYATDLNNRVKGYANIKIDADMIKKYRIAAEELEDITIDKGDTLANSIKTDNLPEGTWKYFIKDNKLENVFVDDVFDEAIDFSNGEDIVVTNDSIIIDDNFKRFIYMINIDGDKIKEYAAFTLTESDLSSIEADAFAIEPKKGNKSATTVVEDVILPESASKFMYAIGEDMGKPFLDRLYEGSSDYTLGDDIEASVGQTLYIFASDDSGRVKMYGKVELNGNMIKDPLAEELGETTHYTNPVKGNDDGTTKFEFLKHKDVTKWKYVISSQDIPAPELNSDGTAIDGIKDITSDGDGSGDIEIETDEAKLKADEGFKANMMIYGLGSDHIKVYKAFDMDNSNVKIPSASTLDENNISALIKGNNPNTTMIEKLEHTGLTSTKFRYKLLDEDSIDIEFNEVISSTSELKANRDVSVSVGKYMLILAVDNSNRTKAFATKELTFDNVKAGNAPRLQSTTNYIGPLPGDENNSTKFTFLKLPANASKLVYKVGDAAFTIPESGSVENGTDYTVDTDIANVSVGKYLMILAVDSDNKVVAYEQFNLKVNQVKGDPLSELSEQAYTLMKGDNPGTTKLKLEPLGLENPSSIRWRYKLVDSIPGDDKDKPYLDEIVEDSTIYNVNYTSKIGPDIELSKFGESYGYILVLATDSSGKSKAYKYVDILASYVREHAPEIDENLKLSNGLEIDTVKFENLPTLETDHKYKYLISGEKPITPATGDKVPNGVIDYTSDADIKVHIGKYLTLYEVDENNDIVKFKSLKVEEVTQGKASLANVSLVEGNIKIGGSSFDITLTDGAIWADVVNDKSIRDKLFNGFKANSETSQWYKVISAMIADGKGSIVKSSNTQITILLPQTPSYDIKEEQEISLLIPAEAIEGALNPIAAEGKIKIKPTVDATISGDLVTNIVRESDIKDGGKSIIVELADGTWETDVSGIIDGFKVVGASDQDTTNWNKIKTAIDPSEDIVRNSGKMLTITLPAVSGVDFGTESEEISLTIASSLIQDASEDVVASPTFTIYPDILKVKAVAEEADVSLMAPEYRIVDTSKDNWTIGLATGSLKENISNSDVIISGLPRGLKADASNVEGKIQIKVSGTASSSLASDSLVVKVKIKATAVTEPNSIDSDEIDINLIKGGSIIGNLKDVTVDVIGNKLNNTSSEMEYSLNSTNGSNGDWYGADQVQTFTDVSSAGGFKAARVYVREKANPKVFHLVTTLSQAKAPTEFNISEVDYSIGIDIKISVDDFSKYEYSLDGGNEWNDLASDFISLDGNTDLRLRYKASEKDLPSIMTNRINVLDLRDVDVDVSTGTIKNTTTAMEYSLNGGDTFANARASQTTNVKFADGNNVVIRERANPNNKRTLVTVGIEAKPTDLGYDISAGEITATVEVGKTAQYRIASDSWKDLEGTIEFKPGQVQVRTKATVHNVESQAVDVGEIIKNPESKPELRVDDYEKHISYWNGSIWTKLEESTSLEYKIDDGEWKDGSIWASDKDSDTIKNTNANVSVRLIATEDSLASQIAVVNFTGNLTWENVGLNVVEGKIEGTSTAMEYSVDSTDGKNGSWITARSANTNLDFIQGMKVFIREKSKPLNFSQLSDGIELEIGIVSDDIDYSILDGSITNNTTRIIEYKFIDGQWNVVDRAESESNPFTKYGIAFKAGTLQFRARGTKDTLPSPTISVNIKSKASAPDLRYDDVNYKIEKIGSDDGKIYQYNINGGTWIDGSIDTEFEGGDTVLLRQVAEKEMLPSQEQTIKFTANLDLKNVALNAGQSKLINTSNSMEYSTNSSDGEDGTWAICSGSETIVKLQEDMQIYIREKVKPRNSRLVTTDLIGKKEFNDVDDFKGKIDFNILQKTISIKNPASADQAIVNDLQYRIDSGNWANVDFLVLEVGEDKVLVYNVNFISGNLEFRLRGDENTLPSDSILKDTISASISAPNLSEGFDIDKYRNIINLPGGIEFENLEYSLTGANGPWIDGVHLNNEDLLENIYIRTKATKDTLPSLSKELTFTPVLNLKTVVFSTHISPFELNGTTEDMEYRINEFEWKECNPDEYGNSKLLKKDGNPLDNLDPVRIIEIRDARQPLNKITIYQK